MDTAVREREAILKMCSDKRVGEELIAEVTTFRQLCEKSYRFNVRWDTTLNVTGVLLSIAIVAAGVSKLAGISAILGAVVTAIITLQRAFPFGERLTFYRVLTGKAENLEMELKEGLLGKKAGATQLAELRLEWSERHPKGASILSQEANTRSVQSEEHDP